MLQIYHLFVIRPLFPFFFPHTLSRHLSIVYIHRFLHSDTHMRSSVVIEVYHSAFQKRWKMLVCLSLGMPQPVSVTVNSTVSFVSFSSFRTMLPCGVNLVAFISRLIRTCCRRESSVSMGISSSSVVNVSSACVCFTLFTVSITFLQMLTASCCAIQNCSLPNSRLDRSITSLISFSNSSEFCWITSLH